MGQYPVMKSYMQMMRPMQPMLAYAEAAQLPYLGCSIRSLLDKPGMMILLVNSSSPAYKAEMKVGDILLEINGNPINTIKDYQVAMADSQHKTVTLTVDRKGQTMKFEVQLD
jgi:S1-C subfamily serine protease